MNDSTKRHEALTFLKSNSLASLATVSANGQPRVRLIYYACDDSFTMYFLSLANTRKVADIHANPKAAVVVAGEDKQHTLQIEGVFQEMTDTATFGPVITKLSRNLFPDDGPEAPLTHMDKGKPVFFKFVPTWIRWGNFTIEHGDTGAFVEIVP